MLTEQLIQIHGDGAKINSYVPDLTGGFHLAWQGDTTPVAGQTITWLAADLQGTGGRQLVQPFSAVRGGLGMAVYEQVDEGFDNPRVDDSLHTTQAGKWAVVPARKVGGRDTLVRFLADDKGIQFDVFGWPEDAGRVVRLGGLVQPWSPAPTVHRWLAYRSEGLLPHIVMLAVTGHKDWALMHYMPGKDGKYSPGSPQVINRHDQPIALLAGQTELGQPLDVILFDLGASAVVVYRSNTYGFLKEISRGAIPKPPGPEGIEPVFVGNLTSDGLSDLAYLRINRINGAQRIAAATYGQSHGAYREMWRSYDLDLPLRDAAWLAIDSGRDDLMALASCWAEPTGVRISLLMPDGDKGLTLGWNGTRLAPATRNGTWLAGRLI